MQVMTAGGRTFATGQRVWTPYGRGTITAITGRGDLGIQVEIDKITAWGRKFWFHPAELSADESGS